MRLDWSTLALQLVNFTILVVLLQRFLYRPVLRVLDARRAAGEAQRAQAQQALQSLAQERAALEAERTRFAAERGEARKAVEAQAQQLMAARRAAAEKDAAAFLEEARKTLAREREQVLGEARRTALALAVEMTHRVLAEIPESMRWQSWLERLDGYLDSLGETERVELAGELEGGAPLRVVTAAALPEAIAAQWRESLKRALGAPVKITFETSAELIGGAELRFPHATLSFSVQAMLQRLDRELEHHVAPSR